MLNIKDDSGHIYIQYLPKGKQVPGKVYSGPWEARLIDSRHESPKVLKKWKLTKNSHLKIDLSRNRIKKSKQEYYQEMSYFQKALEGKSIG